MRYNLLLVYFQYLIFGNQPQYTKAKAIVGDNVRPAYENEFPYVVCILKYDPDEPWENNLICSGTLVSKSHVLTAEHCFDMQGLVRIEITMGGNVLDNAVRYYPIWWLSYNQWVLMRSPLLSAHQNDIMIVKILGLPVRIHYSFMGYVYPASALSGRTLDIAGCGRVENDQYPNRLRVAAVGILNHSACIRRISEQFGYFVNLPEKFFCTFNTPYTLINNGDSGGPLFYNGAVVAINIARCPIMELAVHPAQVNIHLSLHSYRRYIESLLTDF